MSLSIHQPPTLPLNLNSAACPPSYQEHPLILISMDGFRAEYMDRGLTPTLTALARRGVRTPFMRASYPTITFPNHYTIATGLYPPVHGIIANKFFDPAFNATFRLGNKESFKPRWWHGEPIWKTAEKQGKRAATFFWPGSEVEDNRPSYWFPYNEAIPFELRVQTVLTWLDEPAYSRPQFLTLYMHEPDDAGHRFGPNSPEVNAALVRVDAMIKLLVEGLQKRNLLSCVNLMIVSDHGMAEAGNDRVIRLDEFIPNITNETRFWDGVFGRLTPNDDSYATKKKMLDALSCKRKELRVYEKEGLPVRWHVGPNRRVEDIVVDLDDGFSVGGDDGFEADAGDHGYDNLYDSMNAMFVAHGPSFQRNKEVEAFQNIELYNLMCQLLKVNPAPNNGTWTSLHHMLVNPPPYPDPDTHEKPPTVPRVPSYEDLEDRDDETDHEDKGYDTSCDGDRDSDAVQDLIEILQDTLDALPQVMRQHLPWGTPSMGAIRSSTLLLPQPDAVTGYSTLMKMPLWTSYNLDASPRSASSNTRWMSDVRLTSEQSPSCLIYRSISSYNITRYPLFPAYFTRREFSDQLSFLMSNAVPFTKQLAGRWGQLLGYIKNLAAKYGDINVVSGPAFDYDADTFVDDLHRISSPDLLVPTHMFMVVTRCLVWVNNLSQCPASQLDTLAFVYPQYLAVTNCMSGQDFARKFSASVQDVEKITGLKFFKNLAYEDRVRLRLRVHSNIWGQEKTSTRGLYRKTW